MAEDLNVITGSKEEQYLSLIPQLKALLNGEEDLIANLANTAACLKSQFNFYWVGFYLVKNNELVLGPFQGPVACTRIAYGKGVCGTAWKEKTTYVVKDVDTFPGHIACSSFSKSEIVVPLIEKDKVAAVLDIDSDKADDFDETDRKYLEEIVEFLVNRNLFQH